MLDFLSETPSSKFSTILYKSQLVYLLLELYCWIHIPCLVKGGPQLLNSKIQRLYNSHRNLSDFKACISSLTLPSFTIHSLFPNYKTTTYLCHSLKAKLGCVVKSCTGLQGLVYQPKIQDQSLPLGHLDQVLSKYICIHPWRCKDEKQVRVLPY